MNRAAPVHAAERVAVDGRGDAAARARRRTFLLTLVVVATAIGLLSFGHRALDDVTVGHGGRFGTLLIEETTGAYTAALLLLPVIAWARRHPLVRGTMLRALAAHAAGVVLFSLAHTSLLWASRSLVFALLGLGRYDYGDLPWRYAMELPNDVIIYALMIGLTWLADRLRVNRERELRAARLEAALAESRLDALRLQLAPHFLFNSLNAVAATMYDSPRAADEMLARLGDLLRATLASNPGNEHALAEELRLLELYLDIQRARFGARLEVRVDVPAELAAARVPFLLLQPLVENAIEHGADPADGRARVVIGARRDGDALELGVRDHGAGPRASARGGHGIGLANTRARLAAMYGEAARFELAAAEGGGSVARVRLPLRRAEA
ncbi:MAG: histidine kinase [Mizugakiibacter sp.]|uniref:sensor histidine kinase n=1 Tax=Mizugakiibacter sp. TaxID=1972610 RepID=UPI0031BDA5BF|nr:histidine kinase [Xanthomonadaceae bacterium]